MDDAPADAPEPTDRPRYPWCLFRSGAGAYAVGLKAVAEVVEVERLVRLPHSPPRVLGLCALRREVIPVVGLGDGPGPVSKTLVLILRTGRGAWAVPVDPEGTAVAEEPFDEARAGTVYRDATPYTVIDPEATWQEVRRGAEGWFGSHGGGDARETTPR